MNLDTLFSNIGRATATAPAYPRAGTWRNWPMSLVVVLSACAPFPPRIDPARPGLIPRPLFSPAPEEEAAASAVESGQTDSGRSPQVSDTPRIPSAARASTVKAGSPARPADEKADVTLAFDQVSLPTFIQVVFGTILKASFSVDPAVMTRGDLITLRTGQPQTPGQVLLVV